MTVDEKLTRIRTKIERAKENIHDLKLEIQSFLDSQPYKVGAKRNLQTRQMIYYVMSVQDTPPAIATITGEVLYNLRSALDHLAYQLVVIGTGGKGPFRHVYFPISENAAQHKTQGLKKIKGMRQAAIKAIDELKPYGGGNNILWQLHCLNNVDKHRLLITVGSAYDNVNIGPVISRIIRQSRSDAGSGKSIEMPMLNLHIRPADRLFPLKAGDELFIDAPDAELDKNLQFQFEIAFGEPQVFDDKPLLEMLEQMITTVDEIILSFRPLLA